MKSLKTLPLWAATTVFLALAGCDKEPEQTGLTEADYAAQANVSSNDPNYNYADGNRSVSFKSAGGEVLINVECGVEWAVTQDGSDWLDTIVDCEAGTLTLSAGQNTVEQARTANVTIHTAGEGIAFATISVSQDAYDTPEITVGTNEWHAPAIGALTVEITVESSFSDWWIEDFVCEWLEARKTDAGISLTAAENGSSEERSAEIVLSGSDGVSSASDILRVTQDGLAYITLSDGTLTFTETGGEVSVAVESNFDWDFSYDAGGWFSVEREGDGVKVAVSGNGSTDRREGTVVLTASDGAENTAMEQLSIIQSGLSNSLVLVYTTTSAGTQIQLPLDGDVDCTVDWGDGSAAESVRASLPTHTYDAAGKYYVSIDGTVTALNSKNVGSTSKTCLTGVEQWGDTGLTSLYYALNGCKNIDSLPGDTVGAFSEVTTAEYAFAQCGSASAPSYDPSTASGMSGISADLFQYAVKCESFDHVFYADYNLGTIPEGLFRNCVSSKTFQYAFSYCVSVGEIPSGLFDNCPECTSFQNTFYYCSSVPAIPSGLFAKNTGCSNFKWVFYHCTSITEIPSGLFDGMTSCETFHGAFQQCTSLVSVPAGLLKDASACTSIERLFSECESLGSVPDGLFDNLSASCTDFNYLFYGSGISALKGDMFAKNTSVTDIKAMFQNCTKLESIPEGLLDPFAGATDLTSLFSGCSALKSIPGTLLRNNSVVQTFASVFQDCVSLTEIPSGLFSYTPSITSLYRAFYGCTGITSIGDRVFADMAGVTTWTGVISGCTAIESIGEYAFAGNTGATTFASLCTGLPALVKVGKGAFSGCTGVTTVSKLFSSCEALAKVGEGLFSGCTALNTVSNLFEGCTALQSVPGDIFSGCPVTTAVSVFDGCTGLTSVPEEIFSEWSGVTAVTGLQYLFRNCTSLTSIPEGLFAGLTATKGFTSVFNGCTSLEEIPAGLFKNNPEVTAFTSTFTGCISIKEIPAGLFDSQTSCGTFGNTFNGCTALQTIPDGLFDNSAATIFLNCFTGCSSLKSIPAGLFAKCTGVTTFNGTFDGCSGLTSIPPELFDNTTSVTTFTKTFNGCTSLTGTSPYTEIVSEDGSTVKVYLYKRADYPDYFTEPDKHTNCFTGCTRMDDFATLVSEGWAAN